MLSADRWFAAGGKFVFWRLGWYHLQLLPLFNRVAHAPYAIYPDSFDPVTLGHTDLARRALLPFGRLVVTVVIMPLKC